MSVPEPPSLLPPSESRIRFPPRPLVPSNIPLGTNVRAGPTNMAAGSIPALGDRSNNGTADESFTSRLQNEASLHRAGLLQPRSFTPFLSQEQTPNGASEAHAHSLALHDQDTIRTHTMQLSYMQFSPSQSQSAHSAASIQRPTHPSSPPIVEPSSLSLSSTHGDNEPNKNFDTQSAKIDQSHVEPPLAQSDDTDQDQSAQMDKVPYLQVPNIEVVVSSSPQSSTQAPISFPRRADSRSRSHSPEPSGLSRLRREYEASPSNSNPASRSSSIPAVPKSPGSSEGTSPRQTTALGSGTSQKKYRPIKFATSPSASEAYHPQLYDQPSQGDHAKTYHSDVTTPGFGANGTNERTPLLLNASTSHTTPPSPLHSEIPLITRARAFLGLGGGKFGTRLTWTNRVCQFFDIPSDGEGLVRELARAAGKAVPAVILGLLMNILDGVSYGMILFPPAAPFSALGPMGVSLFFLTCVTSQLIYTFGGSGFLGGNGSMMIEVVPFFHILANSIAQDIGEDREKEVIATTLVAFALSSILTGSTFLLLGLCKLGSLIGFFPRHILVGCIGGVGVFLIITGFTVSLRMTEDAGMIDIVQTMFGNSHMFAMWVIPLGLAVLLRVITSRWRHQLIFPLYFIFVPMIFYIVVIAARFDLGTLRKDGWVFDVDLDGTQRWWTFYQYYDLRYIHFAPIWKTLPTQFALLFFNILHPPLNVPALSVSLNEDVDTNRELVAHGCSNVAAGLLGTVPNYLVYVNTLLFYRVGGDTRFAGLLLALATAGLMIAGTGPIAYIPVIVVGALIFILGLDLVKEALWDTRHRVNKSEYITIISIMVTMTVWDFVIGVLFGIIVSCFFFVVQNSQRRSIRALHTGETAMSTVRRPSVQRAYLREVSKQTTVLQLQGFLFFGTITHVEETIRALIEGPSWQKNPVQFLVLDLTLVAGVDMSAAEAFVRLQRLLGAKHVTLVFCGFTVESTIGRALQNVDILGMSGVALFRTFNDAMEWTENAYLLTWFRWQKAESLVAAYALPGRQDADIDYQRDPVGSLVGSPRHSYLRDVGNRTIVNELRQHTETTTQAEPHNTLIRIFSSYTDINLEEFRPIERYLRRTCLSGGHVLWRQGDMPDGLYIVESGVLRASYRFGNHENARIVEESMVAGTLAGELSALSGLERNATVVVERQAVVWKLRTEDLKRLELEEPGLARVFVGLVLKTAKIDYDILLSAIASRH